MQKDLNLNEEKLNELDLVESIERDIDEGQFGIDEPEQIKFNKRNKFKELKFVKRMSKEIWPILIPFFFVMGALVILPLLSIIVYAVIKPTNDSMVFKISLQNFVAIFSNGSIWVALGLSLAYAFIASLIAVAISYPIALTMARLKSKMLAKNLWVLVTMPIWISMILKILGLQSLFYLLAPSAMGTPFAIIVGMVYTFLPFAVSPIYNSLESMDRSYAQAALDLGASRNKAFWNMTFRQSLPGVISAFSLVIIQAATSLLVVRYMGEGKISLITTIIENYFFKGTDFGFGAAISVVLALFVFLIIFVLKALSNKFETRRSRKWKVSSNPAISQ